MSTDTISTILLPPHAAANSVRVDGRFRRRWPTYWRTLGTAIANCVVTWDGWQRALDNPRIAFDDSGVYVVQRDHAQF